MLCPLLSPFFTIQQAGAAIPAETFKAATFDLKAARKADNLAVREVPHSTSEAAGVRIREIRFASQRWDEQGVPSTIHIQAFVAVPSTAQDSHPLPAVISAHGLGSKADPRDVAELARNLHVVALSLSAPGSGDSEGEAPSPQDPRPIFRAEPDIRASWLYQ